VLQQARNQVEAAALNGNVQRREAKHECVTISAFIQQRLK
jgi:hypothetical protein